MLDDFNERMAKQTVMMNEELEAYFVQSREQTFFHINKCREYANMKPMTREEFDNVDHAS